MAQVLEMALGVLLGLGLIGGVFWLAFGRMPDKREPPAGSYSAGEWASSDPGANDGHSG
jgi:hypothetical protein